jgi:hypothetical protein
MPVKKLKIPIQLDTAIDTKSDDFLTPGFATLENVRYRHTGGLLKRNGYTRLTRGVTNIDSAGDVINNALTLKSHKDELVLLSSDSTYSYVKTPSSYLDTNSWVNRDYINSRTISSNTAITKDSSSLSCTSSSSAVVPLPDYYIKPQYAETSNLKIYCIQNGGSANPYTVLKIISKDTGAVILERTFFISNTVMVIHTPIPSVFNYPTIYLIGKDLTTSNVIYWYIPTNNFYGSSSVTTSIAFSNVSAMDVYANAQSELLAITVKESSQWKLKLFLSTGGGFPGSATSEVVLGDYSATGPDMLSVCSFQTGWRIFFHGTFETTSTIKYYNVNSSGAFVGSVVTACNDFTANQKTHMTSVSDSTYTYMLVSSGRSSGQHVVKQFRLDASDTVNQTEFAENAVIQSRPTIYNNKLFAAVARVTAGSGTIQDIATYCIMAKSLQKTTQAFLIAKELDFIYMPGINSNLGYPNLVLSGTTINSAAIGVSDVFTSIGTAAAVPTYQNKVYSITLDFNTSYRSVSLNTGMLVSGSVTKLYDGASYSELGFVEQPLILSTSTVAPGFPTFAAGTYGIAAIYRWTDNNGIDHKSAPEFKTIVAPSGGLQSIYVNVANTNITAKDNIYIDIYMTAVNGTVFYRAKRSGGIYASRTNNSDSYAAQIILDAVPVTNTEILYTQSGELENDAPGSCFSITAFKNRIFTVNKNRLQYSKLINPGEPVQFNGNLEINLEAEGGDATGVYGMDNNLIIFKKNSIYLLSGEGPNNLGEQNDYQNPQLVTADTGNIDLNSIVAYPGGILFKSPKGIYELNRGLYAQYIGAPVAAFNQYSVRSATLLPEVNEIRFVMSNGQMIVYSYYEKRWSIDTTSNALSGVSLNNSFYYVNSSSYVLQENSNFFDDYDPFITNTGTPYAQKVVTGWIHLAATGNSLDISAGVQQFQRLLRIHLLGQYRSAHTLQVSLAYNYDSTIVDTATITPTGTGIYQYRINPSIQKCEAVKITIYDTNTSSTSGESMWLSHLLLEIGLKETAQRQLGDDNSAAAV